MSRATIALQLGLGLAPDREWGGVGHRRRPCRLAGRVATVNPGRWRRRGPVWRASRMLAPILLGALGSAGPVCGEDSPFPQEPVLERVLPSLREVVPTLAPFLRDTELILQLRTYYLDKKTPSGTLSEAWAGGGWLSYRSGWLLDTFGIGATFYGSAPLYAPADTDGTLLLKSGQEGYAVLGEAYAALRYQDYVHLTGYRQLFDQTYINPEDNRMTPNTFEAVTLGGTVAGVQYLAGYLWKIKTRNADGFVSMASAAGATGSDDGVVAVGLRLTPLPGLRLDVSEQYGINTFNTAYAEVDYLKPLNADWRLRLGAQFTDQRAVGQALVANAATTMWVTQVGGAQVELSYRAFTLSAAFSMVASGNTIQTPWGIYRGYLKSIDQDFDQARQKSVGVTLAYDFSKLIAPGLSAYVRFVSGWDAIDPATKAPAPNQKEYDVNIDYRPPWRKGVWLRVRGDILDQAGSAQLGYEVRVILNWQIPLL
jgi:hypothetical protein